MSTLKNVSMGIFALSLAIETPNVLAQVTPSSPSIEEIVVTAQKRSENVMDVPISIAALSTESLERSNIDSMDDIQTIVPGVELRRQVSSLAPFIRGVGSQNATVIGFEPSVALYVDGIYQSQPANNGIGYHHLERIEVLKGPQGTLFGRNASGGAISIVTKDPDHDLSGSAEIGYGNYDTTTADLYITTGITDTLATNLAVSYLDQSEGFGKNVFLDEEVNKQRIFSIRNKWLWKPSEGTEARLTLAYSESQDSPGRARGIYPGTTNFFGFSSLPDFYDVQENYTGGKDTGNSHFEGEAAATESFGATLRMDKDFGPFTLVSITGYLNQEAFFTVDSDFSPAPVLDANLPFYTDQISQEFQLLSNSEGPFNWIGGLYYLSADHDYDVFTLRGAAFSPLLGIDIKNGVKITSFAVFAEGSYEFTSATKLTVGVRGTREKKELSGRTDFMAAPGVVAGSSPYDTDETWTEPTWRVVLDHHFSDSLMTYASYTRGFKSGSYNTVLVTGVPEEPLDPESVDAFEAGLKGQFFDNTLGITAAAFYYEFDNMQLQQSRGGGVQIFVNAASSKIRGADLNAQWVLGGGLQIRAGIAYTDSEFSSFPGGPTTTPLPTGGNEIGSADLKGNSLPRTPDWTGDIAIDHSWVTSIGTFDSNITYYYNDGYPWEVDNRLRQDSYDVVNAKVTWTHPSERFGVTLWGKNLLDEEYAIYAVGEQFGDSYSAAPPRTYGVSIFSKF